MNEPKKHWNFPLAIAQLEKCGYECEGGPLILNDAFIFLKGLSERGPEFLPGQGVWYEVTIEIAGTKLKKWTHYYVIACWMDSDSDTRYFNYNLSNDPPRPWHYGEVHVRSVRGRDLRLEPPAGEVA